MRPPEDTQMVVVVDDARESRILSLLLERQLDRRIGDVFIASGPDRRAEMLAVEIDRLVETPIRLHVGPELVRPYKHLMNRHERRAKAAVDRRRSR